MTILMTTPQTVNPDLDSRLVPYFGHRITGAELSRVTSARRKAYTSRIGSPYAAAVDEAMDAAALAELDRVLQEREDAQFDAMAEASAQLDRLESGFSLCSPPAPAAFS